MLLNDGPSQPHPDTANKNLHCSQTPGIRCMLYGKAPDELIRGALRPDGLWFGPTHCLHHLRVLRADVLQGVSVLTSYGNLCFVFYSIFIDTSLISLNAFSVDCK